MDIFLSPFLLWSSFIELLQAGELQENLGISLLRLFIGFGMGSISGVLMGMFLALSPPVRSSLGFIFEMLRHIPTLVLIPVLVLLMGIGETFNIVLLVCVVFFPVALATSDAVRNIPRGFVELGQLYQLKPLDFYRIILLPASVSPVLKGMRIALGRAWLILIAAEFLTADRGLGQMMESARQILRLDVVLVGVVLTGVIGFGLDRILRLVEWHLMRWRGAAHYE